MKTKRSNAITQGFERTPHRALLKATGVPDQEMKKPFIGIASSFTDLIPGHTGMRELERFIEKGVHTGGGYSFMFGIPGVCDGIAMGHRGMHYSLPTRELSRSDAGRNRPPRPKIFFCYRYLRGHGQI
ncbi:MAG: dihydroxy-acid dehydratase [Desulfuromonadaceae bacterium]